MQHAQGAGAGHARLRHHIKILSLQRAAMEHIVITLQAALTSGKKTVKVEFRDEVVASVLGSVLTTEAGLAIVAAAALQTAAAAPAAAAVLTMEGYSAQVASHEQQCEGERLQQQSDCGRQQEQQSRRVEKGRESGGQWQQEQSGQWEKGEGSGSQRQEPETQQQLEQHVVKMATKYLEHLRSQKQQQQQQHFQTPMQQLSLVEEWDAYCAAGQPTNQVMVAAFGAAATTAEQEMNKRGSVGESDEQWASAVTAAVQAAAAAHLDSAPALAALDAADKADAADAITLAVMEHILMANQAAIASGKKIVKVDCEGRVLASMLESVLATKAGLAIVAAALHTAAATAVVTVGGESAAAAGTAAGVGAAPTVGSNSAETVAKAGGLPEGLLEGRLQRHDSPCLKEQVEGLLWAGLFSINSACDLLQRLSCTLAEATVAGCNLDLGQGQCKAGHATADKVRLAAMRKAEDALAGQFEPPPSAAAAVGGAGMLAIAGEMDQAAGGKPAGEAGGAAAADAQTVAGAKAAEKLAAATACVSAGRESQVGAATEGSGACLSSMSHHATITGLGNVAVYADILQETLQKEDCSKIVMESDTPVLYYSFLEQQGPWFMLQAAGYGEMVRRLNWESGWVEQCGSLTSWSTREPFSAGLGEPQGSKVGSNSMGLQQLLSSAGDVLHDVVMKLPQQLVVEGCVLGEVQRKVVGWRGDMAEPNGCDSSSREWEQQQGAARSGAMEEAYKELAKLFLMLQSCLWGMPVSFCCNNLGCRAMKGISELAQVYGYARGGGFCQGCKVACYCSAECQRRAAPFHKHACKSCEHEC